MTAEPAAEATTLFQVVRGDPTAEELAALVAVLAAAAPADQAGRPSVAPSGWSAYWRTLRPVVHPGLGGWRLSARP